jgi:hypothetical protein
MHVQMLHGLASGASVVNSDVVTLRLKLPVQGQLSAVQQLEEVSSLRC